MVPASLLVGLSIAPTLIAGNGLIAQIMPEETRTEGFSWESASINVGAAMGSALAGVSVDVWDVRAGFGIGPVAATLGVLVAVVGARHLVPARTSSVGGEPRVSEAPVQVPAP
jgi:MFS family permease